MNHRVLGRTSWRVSEVACGTYNSFDGPGERGRGRVLDLMRENLAAGVNLFDSAPMYGLSEENIGSASSQLATQGSTDYLVATKVLQSSRSGAIDQIERSFEVIGGRIDLLQIHNMAGWREVLPYLVELKAQGRIRATGVTDYRSSSFREIEAAMVTGDVDVIQIPYNVMERGAESRLIPLAREHNIGVLVMTPICPLFARGELLKRLRGIELSVYEAFGVRDVGGLCLKWLLSKCPEAILLPATSKAERVRSNAAVSGTPDLPPEELAQLERAAGA
jgi:aryl-alcohol dehydrogenase-like predicted oxidoreductase